jgi:hypothetical protein
MEIRLERDILNFEKKYIKPYLGEIKDDEE